MGVCVKMFQIDFAVQLSHVHMKLSRYLRLMYPKVYYVTFVKILSKVVLLIDW